MATATQAHDDRFYAPVNPMLAKIVEDAKTAYPGKADGDRIHRAAKLIETGAVQLGADNVITVTSNGTAYRMTKHACKDIGHGAVDGRCKHRFAKSIYKALLKKKAAMQEDGLKVEPNEFAQKNSRDVWGVLDGTYGDHLAEPNENWVEVVIDSDGNWCQCFEDGRPPLTPHCQHIAAVLKRKAALAAGAPPLRSLEFVATVSGKPGLLLAFENGDAFFQEYDSPDIRQLTPEEIVYKLVRGREVADVQERKTARQIKIAQMCGTWHGPMTQGIHA